VRRASSAPSPGQRVVVIGDGRDFATAVAEKASLETSATVADGWIRGDYQTALEEVITTAPPGVTVAAGEPSVPVENGGVGGRNTHTALSAARIIADTDIWFAALATDGSDGNSGSAGAVVDGTTIARGGPPDEALRHFDSATYLRRSGDLVETGPTGTNVADVWLVWKPEGDPQPILAP
jgi:glycerate 2-kinase